MRALVTGSGHGGTCWGMEILRASGYFNCSENMEDRKFFKRFYLKKRYATKLVTEHQDFTWKNIQKILNRYDIKIIFMTRHPVDHCLSKIVRGQPSSKGGDGEDRQAPDATLFGSIRTIKNMFTIFRNIQNNYPYRILHVKLENLILDLERQLTEISNFYNIPLSNRMYYAHKKNRNKYQKQRYDNEIDKSQIDMYLRYHEIYDGFFENREKDIEKIKNEVKYVADYLGYEIK